MSRLQRGSNTGLPDPLSMVKVVTQSLSFRPLRRGARICYGAHGLQCSTLTTAACFVCVCLLLQGGAGVIAAQSLPVPRQQATTCVIVKNMFDPKRYLLSCPCPLLPFRSLACLASVRVPVLVLTVL